MKNQRQRQRRARRKEQALTRAQCLTVAPVMGRGYTGSFHKVLVYSKKRKGAAVSGYMTQSGVRLRAPYGPRFVLMCETCAKDPRDLLCYMGEKLRGEKGEPLPCQKFIAQVQSTFKTSKARYLTQRSVHWLDIEHGRLMEVRRLRQINRLPTFQRAVPPKTYVTWLNKSVCEGGEEGVLGYGVLAAANMLSYRVQHMTTTCRVALDKAIGKILTYTLHKNLDVLRDAVVMLNSKEVVVVVNRRPPSGSKHWITCYKEEDTLTVTQIHLTVPPGWLATYRLLYDRGLKPIWWTANSGIHFISAIKDGEPVTEHIPLAYPR